GPKGLLGIAFHPGFANENDPGYRKLYTFHTTVPVVGPDIDLSAPVGSTIDHHNVVTEWQVDAMDPNIVDVSSRREVLRVEHRDILHSGGSMVFDENGYLMISIGSPPNYLLAQDPSYAEGSILRIDPLDPVLTPSSPDVPG